LFDVHNGSSNRKTWLMSYGRMKCSIAT
jgi:hypothetical protein